MKLKSAVSTVLRGIGQVMFQNNPWSGAIMLAGIAVCSWHAALAALLGNIVGNLAAKYLFRCPLEDIGNGLYGFNGTLVGIAAWTFFSGPGLIAGSVLAVAFTVAFAYFKKPGYTAPFILATWLLCGVSALTGFPHPVEEGIAVPAVDASPALFLAFSFNLSQVMLQGHQLAGLLFLAAILVNDRRGAVFAAYGAALPLLFALVPDGYADFNSGLYGYNAVLCSMAFAGPSWRDFMFANIAVVISLIFQWLWLHSGSGLPALTAPFVIATWLTLIFKGRFFVGDSVE